MTAIIYRLWIDLWFHKKYLSTILNCLLLLLYLLSTKRCFLSALYRDTASLGASRCNAIPTVVQYRLHTVQYSQLQFPYIRLGRARCACRQGRGGLSWSGPRSGPGTASARPPTALVCPLYLQTMIIIIICYRCVTQSVIIRYLLYKIHKFCK